MKLLRTLLATGLMAGTFAATPASAQFFMSSRDFSGAPVRGDEPGIGVALPGATDAEVTASLVWNLRAALNISALQCQFEPSLLSVSNYNSVLKGHRDELKKSFDTLTKYFARTNKVPRAGQTALDQYGTQVYGSFSTASAQYGFCQTASQVGRDALFQPRGKLHDLARLRMRALRNALVPWGEQRFPRGIGFDRRVMVVSMDPPCWTRRGEWNEKKCGPVRWVTR